MAFFLACCTYAYFAGIYLRIRPMRKYSRETCLHLESMLLKGSIVVAVAIYCLLLIDGFVRYGIPYGQPIKDIMAAAYTRSVSSELTGVNRAVRVYIFGYIFCFVAMTLGLYRFRQLPRIYKYLLVLVYIAAVGNTVFFIGSLKNIGDIAIMTSSVLLVKFARYSPRLKVRQTVIILLIVVGMMLVLSNVFLARLTLWKINVNSPNSLAYLDINHWMLRFLPANLATGIGILLYYPTHGYYGLSLCLKLPFVWTKGLGSSFALRDILGRYLHTEPLVAGLTYPERMEMAYGWSGYANWVTVFPWLASDFTFVGAIILLALITYVYAISWKEAILGENWVSILMFAFLTILFLYVPANNQLFQTKTSLFAVTTLTITWLFLHGRING